MKIKVLSLFDGCAGARQALDNLGVECEYYASEVDKYAIQIAMKNYPDIIQLGDITKLNESNIPADIDLLIGGSPCQSLSGAAALKESGLESGKSTLFWEYVRILKLVKPKYFLLENVASMRNSDRDRISEVVGVEPICINSALLTAQNRSRYYWSNIPGITQPEDKGLVLKDILDAEAEDITVRIFSTKPGSCARDKGLRNLKTIYEKSRTLTANGQNVSNTGATNVCIGDRQLLKQYKDLIFVGALGDNIQGDGKLSRDYRQGDRVYSSDGKSITLAATGGGKAGKTGLYDIDKCVRRLTVTECEKLQGMKYVEKSSIIDVCTDLLKSYVNVVNKNLKLQKLAGSVEKIDSKEIVKYVEENLNIKDPLINKLAQLNVHICLEAKRVDVLNERRELLLHVKYVDILKRFLNVDNQNIAHLNAFINLILEQIINSGEVGLILQKGKSLIAPLFGSNVLNLHGQETMQHVKDVRLDIPTLEKHMKYIISNLGVQEKAERMLITSFYCVISAIIGYIPQKINIENLSRINLSITHGYTYGVSNTQRYKMIGNGFTIPVIAHILKGMIL